MSSNDSITVFNPFNSIKANAQELSDNTIAALDNRYINVGEDVYNATIDNLNVQNLNISTTGKLYFANDYTEQLTAYDPAITNAQINTFKTTDNTFTGNNKFTNLNIIDSNVSNTINSSSIKQIGSNLILNVNGNTTGIQFKTQLNSNTVSNVHLVILVVLMI